MILQGVSKDLWHTYAFIKSLIILCWYLPAKNSQCQYSRMNADCDVYFIMNCFKMILFADGFVQGQRRRSARRQSRNNNQREDQPAAANQVIVVQDQRNQQIVPMDQFNQQVQVDIQGHQNAENAQLAQIN